MPVQAPLSYGGRSGYSIIFKLARVGLNPARKSAHILLTASFRLALWTGQFTVVPRASFLFSDMTLHHVEVMRVHISRYATPCNVSYTQFLNPLYNIFSPRRPAHRLERELGRERLQRGERLVERLLDGGRQPARRAPHRLRGRARDGGGQHPARARGGARI